MRSITTGSLYEPLYYNGDLENNGLRMNSTGAAALSGLCLSSTGLARDVELLSRSFQEHMLSKGAFVFNTRNTARYCCILLSQIQSQRHCTKRHDKQHLAKPLRMSI